LHKPIIWHNNRSTDFINPQDTLLTISWYTDVKITRTSSYDCCLCSQSRHRMSRTDTLV
jgi:hypothetical protein